MKRALLALATVGLGGGSFADVTVNFSNDVLGDHAKIIRYGWRPQPVPLVSAEPSTFIAQLYYIPDGNWWSAPVPVGDPAPLRTVPVNDPLAGTWIGGMRTIPGFSEDAEVVLMVRVWDAHFSGLDAAYAHGGVAMQSSMFLYSNALSDPPQITDTYMVNFQGAQWMAPEPETYSLVIVGLTCLLLWNRRR